MVKFEVSVAKEDIEKLQQAHVAHDTYALNMKQALENPKTSPVALEAYQKKQEAAVLAFEQAKRETEKKYVPEELFEKHTYDWSVNYNTDIMTVTVKCDCGVKVAEGLGFALENVEDKVENVG